jgi:p-cumate 2,3-dioxygenase subunit alpha
MDTILATPQMVVEDRGRHLFRVARRAFTDDAVLDAERRAIFDRCWLYLGHSSEIADNCDFITRAVGGRELIFNRDRAGAVHAFLNTCPHRGAMVVREKKGNALSFRCFYHGWSFNVNGRFASRFDEGNYGKEHYGGGCADLAQVPRLESYRDFWFVSFDPDAPPLYDYLAGAREYIDLVVDQSPSGAKEYRPGGGPERGRHGGRGLGPAVHHQRQLEAPGREQHRRLPRLPGAQHLLRLFEIAGCAAHGIDRREFFGEWHARSRQRPCRDRVRLALGSADRVPSMGEDKRAVIADLRQGLIKRFGEQRGTRMSEFSRNMLIFPNLVINDIMAITIRTFMPAAPNKMTVSAWALGARDEDHDLRKLRLFNFLEFLGPGGFATPDDQEALENCQRGYQNMREVGWNDISKGMPRQGPPMNDDEEQMRCFWRQWRDRMGAVS